MLVMYSSDNGQMLSAELQSDQGGHRRPYVSLSARLNIDAKVFGKGISNTSQQHFCFSISEF